MFNKGWGIVPECEDCYYLRPWGLNTQARNVNRKLEKMRRNWTIFFSCGDANVRFFQVEKKRIRVSFGANEVRSMSPGAAHSISPPPPSLGAAEIVSGSAHSRLGQPAAAVKMVPTFKKVAVGAGKFEMRKILMPANKTTASTSPLGGQCCHLPSPVKIFRLTWLKKIRWPFGRSLRPVQDSTYHFVKVCRIF